MLVLLVLCAAQKWYDASGFPPSAVGGKGWLATPGFYDRLPSDAFDVVPEAVWDLSNALLRYALTR